jgi:RNA polymerase sigma factor (sigma-70 family)
MDFERRLPHELDHLSDEELIAYAVAAREAGEVDAMADALAVIANRRLPDLTRRARVKVPPQDAEELAVQAMGEAVLARFEGTSVGEFVKLMHTVLSRRIADYYEKRERTVETTDLPDEHGGDDDDLRRDVAISPSETGAVDVQSVIDQALDELSEQHRRVIELYVFEDLSAENTADQVNTEFPDSNPQMSVDNVQQIKARFKKRVRELLGGDE